MIQGHVYIVPNEPQQEFYCRQLSKDLVQPVAIRRNVGFDVFNVRLLIGLGKLLRAKRRYQGDLSASINDALLAVNLIPSSLLPCKERRNRPRERRR